VRGDADPRLLDDYELERRAVGRLTVEQALLRVRDRAEVPVGDRPLLSEAAVAIGYRYRAAGGDAADAGLAEAVGTARRPSRTRLHAPPAP
jgi:hypothetical protein